MSTAMFVSIVSSVLTIAAVLCLVALVFTAFSRRRYPALEHVFWVVVLMRLVIPPLIPVQIPGFPRFVQSVDNIGMNLRAEQTKIPSWLESTDRRRSIEEFEKDLRYRQPAEPDSPAPQIHQSDKVPDAAKPNKDITPVPPIINHQARKRSWHQRRMTN